MSVDVVVDPSVYPVDAVMASAYVYIERCFVFLDKLEGGRLKVTLTAKQGTSDAELAEIAGAFQNELLAQALRQHVAARHERVRETLVARALFGAAPVLPASAEPPGLDPRFLPASDDDYLEDPLGIAVPWEEKYGKGAAGDPDPERGAS
jgi:His-Xaa-Ser system protein HxsD